MTWLLTLYPPKWRRRYGAEFRVLLASQPFSIITVIDIIGGAIDAWTAPQSYPSPRAASHTEGDTIMLAKTMRLRCAGYGAKVTMVDGLKGASVILGGTIATILVMRFLAPPASAGHSQYRIAVMANAWLLPYVVSMRYWLLKGWPARTQAIFTGVVVSAIVVLTLTAGWLAGR